MSYSLQLTIVSRQQGKTPRITSIGLTDPVSSERQAVLTALKAGNPEIARDLDCVESEDDGIAIPLRAFGHMNRCDILKTVNGVEVNHSTFNMIEEAASTVEQKICDGWMPELFLQLA